MWTVHGGGSSLVFLQHLGHSPFGAQFSITENVHGDPPERSQEPLAATTLPHRPWLKLHLQDFAAPPKQSQ